MQPDFQLELFPLHSPLLGESLLVSFPPLINMLKFGGSSYFTSGQVLNYINKQKSPIVLAELELPKLGLPT